MPQLAAVFAALLMLLDQSTALVQSLDVAVSVAPVTFLQAGQQQLVYELHLTNFTQTDVTLAAVEIRGSDGHPLAQYAGAELQRRLTRPGFRNDYATPQIIGPGLRAVVNIWMPVADMISIQSLTHAIDVDVMRPDGAVRTRVVGGAATLSRTAAVELDAPLRGGPWVAIFDPSLKGGHRTTVYTLDGHARIPGRYAIDFIRLPASGAMPLVAAADANGFGEEVLAVADGSVAIAVDGVPDATPPPVSLERGSGNHVAIDLGDGRFAFYEHLQQGSVSVTQGQRVTRGQVIARLGSSGSTSIGPHLHFHVSDASATLAAEGWPFVFRRFTDEGAFASIDALISGKKWMPAGMMRGRQHERPDSMAVIRFP